MSQEEKCLDKEMNGVCTKGKDCPICNKVKKEELKLNVNAQEYKPKKKKLENEKLKFNLNAKEYEPKNYNKKEEDEDEENNEELDMIVKDMVENDILDEMGEDDQFSDSADEDKWYPKYKDCECCKGFVYKCKGEACQSLGQCYCKMKDDCENESN